MRSIIGLLLFFPLGYRRHLKCIFCKFEAFCAVYFLKLTDVEIRRRQLPCYDRPAPPPALKAHLDGDTFRKAQTYSRDKTRFQLLQLVFNQLLAWIMIKSGAYSRLWDVAGRFTSLLGLGPNWIVRVLIMEGHY